MNVLIVLPARTPAGMWPLAGSQMSRCAGRGGSSNALPSTPCAAADKLSPRSRAWHLSHSVALMSSNYREHREKPEKAAVSGPGETG